MVHKKSSFEGTVLPEKLFSFSYLCWWTWLPSNPSAQWGGFRHGFAPGSILYLISNNFSEEQDYLLHHIVQWTTSHSCLINIATIRSAHTQEYDRGVCIAYCAVGLQVGYSDREFTVDTAKELCERKARFYQGGRWYINILLKVF